MKKILRITALAALVFAGTVLAARAEGMSGMKMGMKAKEATLTGTLVDISCYLGDGSTGNDHGAMKACGTACLKGGSPAGLLVGKRLYTLSFPAPAFEDYVGKKVEITGKLYLGTQLVPRKVFMVQDGKREEIPIAGKAMM